MTDPRSVRGYASGRQFDPHNAGGLIRQLSPERVRITSRGIDVVERHVSRFGPDRANAVMLERLRAIADEHLESLWKQNLYKTMLWVICLAKLRTDLLDNRSLAILLETYKLLIC